MCNFVMRPHVELGSLRGVKVIDLIGQVPIAVELHLFACVLFGVFYTVCCTCTVAQTGNTAVIQ